MFKMITYINPHNTFRVIGRGNSIINRSKYFIKDMYYVFKLSLLMILVGIMMVGGLFVVAGLPCLIVSLFI